MANPNFPTIEKVLNDGARILAETIAADAPRRTGALQRSFAPVPLQERDGKLQIQITALEYAVYQDEGVNGILTQRGSRFSYKKSGKMPPWHPYKGSTLTFKGARTIFEQGLKPKNYIQPAADRVIDNFFIPQLEAAGITDFENIITRDIDTQYIKVI